MQVKRSLAMSIQVVMIIGSLSKPGPPGRDGLDGVTATVSATAPVNPVDGQIWHNSDLVSLMLTGVRNRCGCLRKTLATLLSHPTFFF